MAMTEEERKEARRLAAKKWYETHRKAKNAVRKAKAAGVKPMCPGVVKTSGRKSGGDKTKAMLEKRVAKLALKGGKAAVTMKALIKEAAAVATDVHKTGDEKLIDSVMSKLMRAMCLGISPVENGKGILSSTLQASFRVPKAKTAEKPAPGPDVSEYGAEDDNEADDEERPVEIPVGDANDVETASSESDGFGFDDEFENGEGDEDEDSDTEDDEDDEDEDEDDDAEDDERAYARGREDMFRELGEMGVGEEDI